MRRALAPAVLALLAGCGGGDARPGPAPAPAPRERAAAGELRSPDARTPFVRAAGVWRCATSGTVTVRVSADGQAVLTVSGGTLAIVTPGRSAINRDCRRVRARRLPGVGSPRSVVGAATLRCRVPPLVLVDLRGGGLRVRAGDGGFLAGAVVGTGSLDVGGYWSGDCAAA